MIHSDSIQRQPKPVETQEAAAAAHGVLAVSIVSNSRILREGIQKLLAEHLHFSLVGAYSGRELPDCSLPPFERHVALVDCGVGREAAVAWTRYWRRQPNRTYVVILEMIEDVETILACIEAGACGYTLREASARDIAEAIRLACSGRALCSPEVTAQLFARLADQSRGLPQDDLRDALTARELEVLCCIVNGKSNKEIAAQLVIELRTVKQHVHNILGKLNLSHRWDAARLAEERGWFARAD